MTKNLGFVNAISCSQYLTFCLCPCAPILVCRLAWQIILSCNSCYPTSGWSQKMSLKIVFELISCACACFVVVILLFLHVSCCEFSIFACQQIKLLHVHVHVSSFGASVPKLKKYCMSEKEVLEALSCIQRQFNLDHSNIMIFKWMHDITYITEISLNVTFNNNTHNITVCIVGVYTVCSFEFGRSYFCPTEIWNWFTQSWICPLSNFII